MSYTIKGVKTFRGMEGQGFNATLCRDGKPIAHVDDEGCGGCYNWRWLVKDAEALFKAHVKQQLPAVEFEPEDHFISRLVDELQEERTLRRWCKGKTVFRLKADAPGSYHTLTSRYSAAAAAHLRRKHGELLGEIVNERFVKQEESCLT